MNHVPLGSVTRTRVDDVIRLTVRGELDAALTLGLVEGLGDGDQDVELDLAEVTFMDTTGIRLLVQTRSEVRASGRAWSIVAVSPVVYDLLAVVGLLDRFEITVPAEEDPTFT